MIPNKPTSTWTESDLMGITSAEFSRLSVDQVMGLPIRLLISPWILTSALKSVLNSPFFLYVVSPTIYVDQLRALLPQSRNLFTSADMAGLLERSGIAATLTKDEFACVSYSFGSWSVARRSAIPASYMSGLSAAVIQQLTIYTISDFTQPQLDAMSADQRSAIVWAANTVSITGSATQLSVDGALRLFRMGFLDGMLGRSKVAIIPAGAIAAMTAVEFLKLNSRVNEGFAVGDAGWSTEQVRAWSLSALAYFNNTRMLSGQPAQLLGKMSSDQLLLLLKNGALTSADTPKLDAKEIAKIPLSTIAQLTRAEFSNFSVAIKLMTPEQRQAITIDNFVNAMGGNLGLLNLNDLGTLSDVQWASLNSAMIARVGTQFKTAAEWSTLSDTVLRKLTPYFFSQLSLDQVNGLLVAKRSMMTASQLAALKTDTKQLNLEILAAAFLSCSTNQENAKDYFSMGLNLVTVKWGDNAQSAVFDWGGSAGPIAAALTKNWAALRANAPQKLNDLQFAQLWLMALSWTLGDCLNSGSLPNLSGSAVQGLMDLYEKSRSNGGATWFGTAVGLSISNSLQGATPAVISTSYFYEKIAKSISGDALSWLSAVNVKRLSDTGMLTPDRWGQLSKPIFMQVLLDYNNRFGGSNVSMIDALNKMASGGLGAGAAMTWLSESTSWNFSRLTPTDVALLELPTVRLITAGDFIRMPLSVLQKFSASQVGVILPPTIGALRDTLATFTAEQLKGMVPQQAGIISPLQVTQFSYDQYAAVVVPLAASLAPGVIGALTPAQFAELPSGAINSLVSSFGPAQLAALTTAQIAAMRPEQVWAMSFDQLLALGSKVSALSYTALLGLSKAQVQGNSFLAALPVKGLAQMSRAAIAAAPTASLVRVRGEVLVQLPDMSWLSEKQILSLTAQQIAALSTNQLAQLWKTPVLLMSAGQIAALGVDVVMDIQPMTLAQLDPLQVAALTTAQLAALSQQQIEMMSSAIARYFTQAQWKAFSSTQLNWFQSEAISELNDTAKFKLLNAGLSLPPFFVTALKVAEKPFKIDPALTLTIRNAYSDAHAARALTGFGFGLHGGDLVNSESALAQVKEFWSDYRKSITQSRRQLNGARLVGSALSISAVTDVAMKAWLEKDDPLDLTNDILKTLLWSASLLQVPASLLVNMLDSYKKEYKSVLEAELTNRGADALKGDALTKAQTDAEGVAAIAARAKLQLTFKEFVGIDQIVLAYRENMTNLAEAEFGRRPLNATLSAISQVTQNDMIKLQDLRSQVASQSQKWMALGAAPLKALERRDWGSPERKLETRAGAMLLVTDFLTSAQGFFNLTSGKYKGKTGDIVIGSINGVLGLALLVGDIVPIVAKTESSIAAGLAGASRSQMVLGVGTVGIFLANQIYGSVQAHLDYKKDPTTGKLVGVILNDVFSAFNLGAMAVGFAVGGPVGVVAAIASLLVPNPSAIGQAIDIKKQRETLLSTGRSTMADNVLSDLYTLAVLNATPIINFTSIIYTPVILSKIWSRMSADNYKLTIQAAAEDFKYQTIATKDGQGFTAAIRNLIDASSGLMGVRYITAGTVAAADYYAANITDTKRVEYISAEGIRSSKFSSSSDLLDVSLTGTGQIVLSSAYDEVSAGSSDLREYVYVDRQETSQQRMIIDATGSTRSRTYAIAASMTTIKAGGATNKYIVNMDKADYNTIVIQQSSQSLTTAPANLANADEMELVTSAAVDKSYMLNLDSFDGVTVNGVENSLDYRADMGVTGTKMGRRYKYAGGMDTVTLLGGNAMVIAGGNGTKVTLGGGLNLAYAALGVLNRSTQADAVYTGGAIAKGADGKDRENTISFQASAQQLKIEINDPSGVNYSRASTVYASTDINGFADGAQFTQFQNVIGSNLGDYFSVRNTTNLGEIRLGQGANTAIVSNSTNLKIVTGMNADLISLQNSGEIVVESRGRGTVYDEGVTALYMQMLGQGDVLELGTYQAGDVMVRSGSGFHDINLAGNLGRVEVMSQFLHNRTNVYDVENRTAALDLSIGQDISSELIKWDSVLQRLEMYASSSDQLVAFDIDEARAVGTAKGGSTTQYVSVTALKGGSTVSASVNYLVEAMAALPAAQMSKTTVDGKSWQGYNMADVFGKVAVLHSRTV